MNITHKLLQQIDTVSADKIALIDDQGSTTYGELKREIARCRLHLDRLGIGAGDRVIFCMLDSRSWLFYYFAVHHVGAISILMNPALPPMIAQKMVATCQPRAILCRSLDRTPALASLKDLSCIQDLDTMTPSDDCDLDACYQYSPDETAHWCTSSGTSGGVPKWVIHGAEAIQTSPWVIAQAHEMNAESVVYCTPRLSFHYGLMHSIAPLTRGGCAVLSRELPSARFLIDLANTHSITHIYSTPHILSNLVTKSPDDALMPSLRFVYSGGEQLPMTVEQRFFNKFGVPILNCIGMAEIYSWCTTQLPQHRRSGSIGQCMDHMDIEIRDPATGTLCAHNEPGELWVRSPTRALGYHANPEANALTFPNGWYRSSDIVYRDKDGWLFYVCRNDNNARIKAGFVNLAEIESFIIELPCIEDCMVYITQSTEDLAELGAKIKVQAGQSVSAAEIRQHLARYMVADKIPRRIDFVDNIARTVTTKKIRG